jgi:hypothetical protein
MDMNMSLRLARVSASKVTLSVDMNMISRINKLCMVLGGYLEKIDIINLYHHSYISSSSLL